ncbi:MAG: hypothetical protein AB7V19_05860 [Candidatus Bipolaricaulia bacterium]
MERALERIALLQGTERAFEVETFLARVGKMEGAVRLFARIEGAGDAAEVDDHLATARYALMFAGLAFEVVVEPTGREGPDLSIARDGHSAAVEVTRFRKMNEGPSRAVPANLPNILPEYGDPLRDIRKVRDKVTSKFRQLRKGTGVVAIWNDDGDLEELEAYEGVAEIAHEAMTGVLCVPPGLYLVVCTSHWVSPGTPQQVHCYELQPSCPLHFQHWKADLDTSLVRDLIRRALSS